MGLAPPWWPKWELVQFPWLAQVAVCRLLLGGRVHSLCHLLLGSRVGQPRGGAEFVRPVGGAPLRDCSNTGFQVVRRRRDGAPGPRPASAGRETGSRVFGASPSGSGVPRSRSHSRENVRPRASGPQGPRPQDAAPRKRDRSADSVGSTGSGSAGGRGGTFKKRCYNCHQKGHRISECPGQPSQPAATVSAVPAVASAGVAPSRDARAAAVVEPQQCFEEVRAAACCERAAALALAGLEPLVGAGRPTWRWTPPRLCCRERWHCRGWNLRCFQGRLMSRWTPPRFWCLWWLGTCSLVLQFPRLGPRHLWRVLCLLWCRWSPPRVNRAPGRVLRLRLPVTTGSGGTRRGGPQLAGSSLLLREELLPWRD